MITAGARPDARRLYDEIRWEDINRGLDAMIAIGYPVERLGDESDYDRILDFVRHITVLESGTPISRQYGCYTLTASRRVFKISVDVGWNYSRYMYEQTIEW